MADERLDGLNVAILVADGFEEVELTEPREALDQAGADTNVVSPKADRVRSWNFADWGSYFPVDVPLEEADPDDFDALLLPGGVFNPDTLRIQPKAVAFVKAFFDDAKPVAAICHGPWTIINAGGARGRRMTSWPSLPDRSSRRRRCENRLRAVVDQGLVTSRRPARHSTVP
jgi:protease I